MASALAATALLLLFLGATLLTDRLRKPWRYLPMLALVALCFALFVELTRYDQGLGALHRTFGMMIAPLVAIFGGAAWGVRRFYGWPDLGAHPPRAALMALAILTGVLVGARMQADDVARTEALADATLAATGTPAPRDVWMGTVLGVLNPPSITAGQLTSGEAAVSYPVGTGVWRWRMAAPEADATWRTARGASPLRAPTAP